jgi:hypothetical protein
LANIIFAGKKFEIDYRYLQDWKWHSVAGDTVLSIEMLVWDGIDLTFKIKKMNSWDNYSFRAFRIY